eukprot:6462826-Amphidinium_carterae.1
MASGNEASHMVLVVTERSLQTQLTQDQQTLCTFPVLHEDIFIFCTDNPPRQRLIPCTETNTCQQRGILCKETDPFRLERQFATERGEPCRRNATNGQSFLTASSCHSL